MNPNNPVSEIMTTKLVTVSPDDFLVQVTKIFGENNFHHIPVVKEGSKLAGIISKEDFQKMSIFLQQKKATNPNATPDSDSLRAADIMTGCPLSLDPDDSVGLAADVFLANRFHSLPVVDDGQLVGLVTSHDLIAYAFKTVLEKETGDELVNDKY